MVYVLDSNGQPLMPTSRHGKIRRLLKEGKAKVVKRCPFTIQLLYETTNYIQDIVLGVDAGSKHIGLSATTDSKVLYEADVELRTDIVKLLSSRRELRGSRRNRKTRYRPKRFNNRVAAKREGWLPPSVRNKINSHIAVIKQVHQILPVTQIIVELAAFDIQKIKNPDISAEEYQNGEQKGFSNVREYVLYRDNHTCQCCKGKSKDCILNVHHIESRQTGGNAPNNLVTLCKTCHDGYHKGTVQLPKNIKRGQSFKDSTFMSIMKRFFYEELQNLYSNVSITYGYITKQTRFEHNLPKEHYIDARCISGHPAAISDGTVFYIKKVRCHNRQLHKCKPIKGGIRKLNQAPKYVFGFQLFDKVRYNGIECFVFGRRSSGSMDIRLLGGIKVHPAAGYKKLELLETRKSYIIERRTATSSPCLKAGVSVA